MHRSTRYDDYKKVVITVVITSSYNQYDAKTYVVITYTYYRSLVSYNLVITVVDSMVCTVVPGIVKDDLGGYNCSCNK